MKDPYVLEDGTLKNLLGITDYNELKKAEKDIGFIKLTTIDSVLPSPNFDVKAYKKLHQHIFGDIFSWAGEYRTVPLYKEEVVIPGLSLNYCDYRKIPAELEKSIFELNNVDWNSLDLNQKSQKFTELLAKLWRVHAFRDGNTRATLAFGSLFAKEHGFPMDFHMILDNLTRQVDANGKITRFSIRDKFVLAALDPKDYPEPEHLAALFKQSMISASSLSRKLKVTPSISKVPSNNQDQEER